MSREPHTRWTTARVVEPTAAGYIVIAARSGPWRLPPAIPSRRRQRLLARVRDLAASLVRDPAVEEACSFRGVLRPPGDRSLAGQWRGPVEFDAVLLVQTADPSSAERLLASAAAHDLPTGALAVAGGNVRRIADVDHSRPGVFLFNFFTADDVDSNIAAWQYTAGWFQHETGLDNSTVIAPTAGQSPFALVNHCRWNSYRDVLPSLIGKRSFQDFVLRTFHEHRVAPHPALYALDRRFGERGPSATHAHPTP